MKKPTNANNSKKPHIAEKKQSSQNKYFANIMFFIGIFLILWFGVVIHQDVLNQTAAASSLCAQSRDGFYYDMDYPDTTIQCKNGTAVFRYDIVTP